MVTQLTMVILFHENLSSKSLFHLESISKSYSKLELSRALFFQIFEIRLEKYSKLLELDSTKLESIKKLIINNYTQSQLRMKWAQLEINFTRNRLKFDLIQLETG